MDLLQLGQKINIYIHKDNKLVEICCEISKIQEDRLTLELPQYFMRYIEYLDVGCRLTLKVFSKMGTIDFNAIVISNPLEDDFTVEFDQNAMKYTPTEEIPVIKSMENLLIKTQDVVINTKTFEISTEFIKFYSDKNFNINESYDCDLILPNDYGTISFRITISERDDTYNNEYKANYYYMSEQDRQLLLYYMYLYTNESEEIE